MSFSIKKTIGIEKEKTKTFLSLCLMSATSLEFLALDSSGNSISKLAANN